MAPLVWDPDQFPSDSVIWSARLDRVLDCSSARQDGRHRALSLGRFTFVAWHPEGDARPRNIAIVRLLAVRNAWKGLVIGGLTGAIVGIALDALAAAMRQATRGAEHARERAPDALEWLQAVTERATDWVHDTDVPEKVREVSRKILESDLAATANATASKVVETTKDMARTSLHHPE